MITNYVQSEQAGMSDNVKKGAMAGFIILGFILTRWSMKKVRENYDIKMRDGYKFEETDYNFDNFADVSKLAVFCAIAGVLCGCTGIAGGMILGPLFLTYNMVPSVMSATNQYISMIAALSVVA